MILLRKSLKWGYPLEDLLSSKGKEAPFSRGYARSNGKNGGL
jgi:hypothetical protein